MLDLTSVITTTTTQKSVQESHQWLMPGGVFSAFSHPGGIRRNDEEAKLRQESQIKSGSATITLQNKTNRRITERTDEHVSNQNK